MCDILPAVSPVVPGCVLPLTDHCREFSLNLRYTFWLTAALARRCQLYEANHSELAVFPLPSAALTPTTGCQTS